MSTTTMPSSSKDCQRVNNPVHGGLDAVEVVILEHGAAVGLIKRDPTSRR
jgi:hypothetical protein